jgi:hypothetical protein
MRMAEDLLAARGTIVSHQTVRRDPILRASSLRCRPDLNPIEMAFAKLKRLLRKRAARSFNAIFHALGEICDLFSVSECRNCFKAAGYEGE